MALILGVATAIVAEAWTAGQSYVRELGGHLVADVSLRTRAEVLRHLEPAEPFTRVGVALVRSGELDLYDEPAVLAFLEAEIDANPSISWASVGRADGRYLAVYRWPGEPLRRTLRKVPVHVVEQRNPDGTWAQVEERPTDYDPRVRPWYLAATGAEGGVWTEPYVFLSRQQVGVAHALAVHDDAGEVVGVFAAELEAGSIAEFLADLHISEHGRAYLVDESGRVVAHPDGLPEGVREVPTIAERDDPRLGHAWAVLQGRDLGRYQALVDEGDLISSRPFPSDLGIPWLVVTVVPLDDYLGPIRASRRRAILIALLVLLIGIGGAIAFSRTLTRVIGDVREEMGRLATFELTDRRLADHVTGLRELNEMARATDAMKHGLRSFSRYVPHQLVRQLLRSGGEARLGAERREMTVLFTDIAGFTTIVESTPPDEVLEALGRYLQRMNTEIHATDGTVCQYLGDAIEAFWGAPEPHPDHALRACRSALAMRDASRAMAAAAEEEGRPVLRTRFGVATGEVMVGNVGAPERFNYAIVGDSVNFAARLESLNKVYATQVLIGPETAGAVDGHLVVRPVDLVRVKGKEQPALVWELVGETATSDVVAALGVYAQALDCYRAGRFREALDHLAAVAEALPGDGPTAVLRERCAAYLEDPPPAGWDGVFEMTHK